MTAVRLGASFALEDEFGKGPGANFSNGHWLAAPPNFFLTYSHHRSTNRMDAMGTKKFDYIAYGGHHGTWSATFTADYEYLEPFLSVFEDYTVELYGYSWTDPATYRPELMKLSAIPANEKYTLNGTGYKSGEWTELVYTDGSSGAILNKPKITKPDANEVDVQVDVTRVYKHLFKKVETKRVPSMCFRRVQLNKVVGGKKGDEILEIYGAVCTEFSLSLTAGSSQVQVSMSGFAKDVKVKLVDVLPSTEYVPYTGEHVMFACLFSKYKQTS